MDRKALIRNLNQAFCDNQKEGSKKFTEAWLSYIDFGGLYFTDEHYILTVKAAYLDGLHKDIREVLMLIQQKAEQELKHIAQVSVRHVDDRMYCTADDFPVFKADESC